MLEILGRRYVIDHCVLRLKQISEYEAYRTYITDALQGITNNTARLVNKDGMVIMSKRFADMISNKKNDPIDIDTEQKAQEIKLRISNLLDKLGKEDG